MSAVCNFRDMHCELSDRLFGTEACSDLLRCLPAQTTSSERPTLVTTKICRRSSPALSAVTCVHRGGRHHCLILRDRSLLYSSRKHRLFVPATRAESRHRQCLFPNTSHNIHNQKFIVLQAEKNTFILPSQHPVSYSKSSIAFLLFLHVLPFDLLPL